MIFRTNIEAEASQLVFDLLGKAQACLKDFGAEITAHGGFEEYQTVDRDGAMSFGGYHPRHSSAQRGLSLIVSVDGSPVATYAGALYDTGKRSMADFLHEVGTYDDGTSDRMTASGRALAWLNAIRGKVQFSGGIWIRGDYRKSELSTLLVPLLPLIGRSLGVELWAADHIIGLIEKPIQDKGVAKRYRLLFHEPGGTWIKAGREIPLTFVYQAPIFVTYDALEFIKVGREYLASPSSPSIQRDQLSSQHAA